MFSELLSSIQSSWFYFLKNLTYLVLVHVSNMENALPTCELNMRCAGVKRLLKEAYELRVPNELFVAEPIEGNLFEWHFTIRGPPDTVYENGIYHGRIILPAEYPMKPPSLILLTPNGRFETNKKICLSISGYHPETWLPSWSIRTALLGFIGFMPSHSAGAIGGLECSDSERKKLALKSLDWHCNVCNCVLRDILPMLNKVPSSSALLKELHNTPPISLTETSTNNVEEFKSDPTNDSITSLTNNGNRKRLKASLPNMTQISAEETINNSINANTNRASSDHEEYKEESSANNHLATQSNQKLPTNNWTAFLWIILFLVIFIALLLRRIYFV